jgi:hypothetical protein
MCKEHLMAAHHQMTIEQQMLLQHLGCSTPETSDGDIYDSFETMALRYEIASSNTKITASDGPPTSDV